MKLKTLVINYEDDENGVPMPRVMAHLDVNAEPSDPTEFLFYPNGQPKPFLHTMEINLLNPRPEDDPNANLTVDKIARIKADVLHHAKDGIYINWDKEIKNAETEVAGATKAVVEKIPGADARLVEAEEWKALADARVSADWITWAKSRM